MYPFSISLRGRTNAVFRPHVFQCKSLSPSLDLRIFALPVTTSLKGSNGTGSLRSRSSIPDDRNPFSKRSGREAMEPLERGDICFQRPTRWGAAGEPTISHIESSTMHVKNFPHFRAPTRTLDQ